VRARAGRAHPAPHRQGAPRPARARGRRSSRARRRTRRPRGWLEAETSREKPTVAKPAWCWVLSPDQRDGLRSCDRQNLRLVSVASVTWRQGEVSSGQVQVQAQVGYIRPVVRLGTFAIALSLAGCTGDIQSDIYENLDPKAQAALEKWVEKALPVLSGKCVERHGGSMPEVA